MDEPITPVYYRPDDEAAPAEGTEETSAVESEEPSNVESESTPAPRRRRWTVLIAIVVAVVVVVGAFGFLYLSGNGPFANSHGPADVTASGESYSSALSDANQSASAYGSGTWAPLFAAGVDMPTPLLESTAVPGTLFGSSCPGTNTAQSSVVTFDGFNGDESTGTSPNWLFMLIGPSNTILVVVVLNGQGSVLEKYSGSGCGIFTGSGGIPGPVADSSRVVQTFMSGGGKAFIGAHPGGFLTMDVFGAYGVASWHVGYSTCPTNGSTKVTSAYNYSEAFFVDNGSAAGSPVSSGSPHCAGLDLTGGVSFTSPGFAPLSAVLGVSSVSASLTATGAVYKLNITRGANYIIWNDLTFTLVNSTGGVPSGALFNVLTITQGSGCTVATGTTGLPFYSPPSGGGCASPNSGGSAIVRAGEVVTISNVSQSSSGSLDTLEVSGSPTYSGLLNESVPPITTALTPISAALGLSPVSMSGGGTSFSVRVNSTTTGLILPEVSFQILNSSGLPAVGPYFVTVFSSTGCQIANAFVNSSSFSAPIFNGCSSGVGATAPLLAGDSVSISTSPALAGSGYEFITYGHNLYDSSIVEPFDGVVTQLSTSVSIGSVVGQNTTSGYTYSVNVTSASSSLEWKDVTVGVNTTGGVVVPGPTGVTILDSSGCEVATGVPDQASFSVPTTNACSGQTLGGSASVRTGEKIVVVSSADLVGFTRNDGREEFNLAGLGAYGGTVYTPIPITGGPLFDTLMANLPIAGTNAGGYYYNLTINMVQGPFLADNLAVTAANGSFVIVPGPYMVNITAPSGCVLATGPANSTAYTVPTYNACASGALGASTPLAVGDTIILYSTVDLTGGHYIAFFAFGAFYGNFYYGT